MAERLKEVIWMLLREEADFPPQKKALETSLPLEYDLALEKGQT